MWKIEETSEWLYVVCKFNPFTYAVETIRFSLYAQVNLENSVGIITCTIIFLTFSIIGYDPARRSSKKREVIVKIIIMSLLFFALELNAKGDLSIRAKTYFRFGI